MKAEEILRRYAAGERNFCNADLRGANFRGQDLSGADFSKADIRLADFRNATLRDANFTNALGGLQKRWTAVQVCLIGLSAAILGVFQGVSGGLVEALFYGSLERKIASCVYLAMVVLAFAAILFKGFDVSLLKFVLIPCQWVYAIAFFGMVPEAPHFSFTVAFISIPSAIISLAAQASIFVRTEPFSALGAFAFLNAFAGAFITVIASSTSAVGGAVGVAFAVTSLLLSLYVARQALVGDKKFKFFRFSMRSVDTTLGDAYFYGADLTRATFSQE
jgi:hypothetical protein